MNVRTKKEVVVFFNYLARLGVIRGSYLYFILRFLKKESVRIPGLKHAVYLRKNTSDLVVFNQIFIKRQYNFNVTSDIRYILDCGANIGLASVYFANRFPNSIIVAVEPEDGNFEMLKKNCGPYKNIKVLKNAVWYKKEILHLHDPGLGNYGFMTHEGKSTGDMGIEALGIDDILQQYPTEQIDLLKIDIEGAEKELFMYNVDGWLPKTKLLTIEVHDRLREGASATLIKALARYDFSISSYGESFVCERGSK